MSDASEKEQRAIPCSLSDRPYEASEWDKEKDDVSEFLWAWKTDKAVEEGVAERL